MTLNPPAVADRDGLTVRRTISIAAPPEKVWTAITAPEHVSRWFGDLVLDGAGAGAAGTITWPGERPVPIRVQTVDAPRSITYRWCHDPVDPADAVVDDDRSTDFTFTLTTTPSGTDLTVEEVGFERTAEPITRLEEHRGGWDEELDTLVAVLEGARR